jgi:hypothetical protein
MRTPVKDYFGRLRYGPAITRRSLPGGKFIHFYSNRQTTNIGIGTVGLKTINDKLKTGIFTWEKIPGLMQNAM